MAPLWDVSLSNRAKKNYESLKRNGSKPSIASLVNFLLLELETMGPVRSNWPNYGKLSDGRYHCHLKKGRPTFVACWEVIEHKIEVYYVGTHEGAPYS
jgi:hypothetical protein